VKLKRILILRKTEYIWLKFEENSEYTCN
jgi:hypothetical protein